MSYSISVVEHLEFYSTGGAVYEVQALMRPPHIQDRNLGTEL